MCTLIVMRNAFRFYPLVVAANRDEALDRPAKPPEVWEGEPRILAPVDEKAGGTWIGVSEYGVFAGITNRDEIRHDPNKVTSRGSLVLTALEADTAYQAARRIESLDGSLYNGFNLVVSDRDDTYLLSGNGKEIRITVLGDGLHIITSRGTFLSWNHRKNFSGQHDWIADRLSVIYRKEVIGHPPRPSGLNRMLTQCSYDHGNPGTCIHRMSTKHGTRSSTVIRLTDDLERFDMWHREGHACEGNFGPQMKLKLL